MQFTQIPPQYAPLGSEVRYVVEQETAADIDIRIYDLDGKEPELL